MLNIENIKVIERKELDDSYVIHAQSLSPIRICFECGSKETVIIGKRIQPYTDTPMHGKTVKIEFERKRLRCKNCNKTSFEHMHWLSDDFRMTTRAEEYVMKRCNKVPFLHVASEMNVTEGTIRNIFSNYVSTLEKTYVHQAPRVLGIDETHLNKVMRLVLTNIEKQTLIDLKKERSKPSVKDAICRLHEWEKIEIVTMDMWRPYRDAIADILPNAVIVIDRFHVAKMANEAMDKARKAIRSSLDKKERIKLKGDRKILFKRRDDITGLNELASFEFWTYEYPELMDAYNAKEGFLGMWDMPTRADAEDYWNNWLANIPKSIRKYFCDAIRAVTNWLPYILNWWDYPYTNAFTESLNNLIKIMHRNGRGYSFEVLRAKMLFTKGELCMPSKSLSSKSIYKKNNKIIVDGTKLKSDVPLDVRGVDMVIIHNQGKYEFTQTISRVKRS